MSRKAKNKPTPQEAVKVFHICRYEQWFELPASSGYCNAGPLKFFRFFVSGSDPSAKEFHERVDRLSREGDEHHLLGVYTRLVTWASMQPRTHRGFLLDIDYYTKPMTFEDLAWKLDLSVEVCTADLAALTKCRLIEFVDMPTVWGENDDNPTTAPAGCGGDSRAPRESGPAGESGHTLTAESRAAAPQNSAAEHSGVPEYPVIENYKPERVTGELEPEPERVTGEPEGPLGGLGRENQQPDAQGQPQPKAVTQGQPEAQGEPEAQGKGLTQILGMESPIAGDNQTCFHPPRAAARGRVGNRSHQPPEPADSFSRAGRFAVEMFKLVECRYPPKSQEGLSELASFANAWRRAEALNLLPSIFDDLWESMEKEAKSIAMQRKNKNKHWKKSPESKLMYLFNLKLAKRAASQMGGSYRMVVTAVKKTQEPGSMIVRRRQPVVSSGKVKHLKTVKL